MKQFTLTIILSLFAVAIMAQVPAGFSYQAVVRSNSGEVVASQTVKFKFSILQNSTTGTPVYVETQSKETNEFGLANLVVGKGAKVSGNFDPSAWGSHTHFLKVELDPNNGNTFSHLGTMQLMAVPYAFHSQTVEVDQVDDADHDPENELQELQLSGTVLGLSKSSVTVTLPSTGGGDNWGTDVVTTDATLEGHGTDALPLTIAKQSAANGQVLKWNGTTWLPAADETGESTADDLGNHTATQNIRTNGHWISGDGENEGIFVMDNGKVGIGIDRPGMSQNPGFIGLFESRYNDQGAAIIGSNTYSGSQVNYGGWFEANGSSNGTGVYAKSSSLRGRGVSGNATGDSGIGVVGNSSGAEGKGVAGLSSDNEGIGVYGSASSTGGLRNYGGYFQSKGETGVGVYGLADYSSTSTKNNYGGYFESHGRLGRGVYASATGEYGRAVYAISTGENGYGITAYSDNIAGYFGGNVSIVGTLSKSAGSFKIDHPDDPENKYLQHSFVESPDMMNVYNGNVILDNNGEAMVDLPGYFESLNIDFRYQLTAIGWPGPNLYIAKEIENNQFEIAGGSAGMKVSWQVTGIRNDAYARNHRIEVEISKEEQERGKYLFPDEHNVVKSLGIHYEEHQELLKHQKEMEADLKKAQARMRDNPNKPIEH